MPQARHAAIRTVLLLTAAALVATLLAACGDDDDDTPTDPGTPATGTVEVVTSPTLAAPWSLAGPDGYAEQGSGDHQLDDLSPGDYTITWGAFDGHATPAPETGTLAAGEVVRFTGVYEALAGGTIVVTTLPATLDGPWQVTGPAAYQASGTGSGVLTDLDPGEYAIAWQRLPLYLGPAPLQMDVTAGGTTTFEGEYRLIGRELPEFLPLILQDAHTVRAVAAYTDLLGSDFRFIRQGGEPSYGYDTEVTVIDRIFSGAAGSNGMVVADIAFLTLEPLEAWQETPANDPDFGGFLRSLFRTYEIRIDFEIADQSLVLRVQGPVTFYVQREQDVPGSDYELLGIVDRTLGGKATENFSWTDVRELFR